MGVDMDAMSRFELILNGRLVLHCCGVSRTNPIYNNERCIKTQLEHAEMYQRIADPTEYILIPLFKPLTSKYLFFFKSFVAQINFS